MWNTSSTTTTTYTTGTYPYQTGGYVLSGSSSPIRMSLPEDTLISCQLKDKTLVYLTLKEYVIFITIHGISPSECEDKADYEEKMGALTI